MAPRKSSRLSKIAVNPVVISDDENPPPLRTISKKKPSKPSKAGTKKKQKPNEPLLEIEHVAPTSNSSACNISLNGTKALGARNKNKNSRQRNNKDQSSSIRHNENVPPQPRQRRNRAQVISLDVTYSSEESNDDIDSTFGTSCAFDVGLSSASNANSIAAAKKLSDLEIPTIRPRKEGRGILSDSSDSDNEVLERLPMKEPPLSHTKNLIDEDSDSDIYSLNHDVEEKKVLERVRLEMNALKKNSISSSPKKEAVIVDSIEEDDCFISSSPVVKPKSDDSPVLTDDDMDSLGINISDVVLRNSNKRRSQNKKTKQAFESLKAIAKRLDTYNDSRGELEDDILVVSEDEAKQMMTVLVRWGADFFTHKICADESLFSLYKHISELHSVNIGQIMLSFQDNVLSPESRPCDIGLTSADFIDGGILTPKETDASQGNDEPKKDEVSLKFQNENRKECIKINVNKYDKMLVAMNKYADLKGVKVSKLRFRFDGENLNPDESPFSLDLEGGECIDVFTV